MTEQYKQLTIPDADASEQREFAAWFNSRPEKVRRIIADKPPWNRYRIKVTGQHCCLYSYSEDGTVTVTIDGHDSEVLAAINRIMPVNVFGIDPDDLEIIEI
jgi:hypothetical protein